MANTKRTNRVWWAAAEAERLVSPLGDRWQHVKGVVALAETLRPLFSKDDANMLLAAAYLHDIGYAPELMDTGFHPLDGARYLRAISEERLACLVAHHTEARIEAQLRGLQHELDEFPREESPIADALTSCDIQTGPTGQHITLDERGADIQRRYGAYHLVTRAFELALPSYRHAVAQTAKRLM